MDKQKLDRANNRFDAEFGATHTDFVIWWHKHPACDPDPKFAVPARVAFKCQSYREEFMESKQHGAA